MKTVIEFKDGRTETVDDAMPAFCADTNAVSCVNSESTVLTDDVPLSLISKVTFEATMTIDTAQPGGEEDEEATNCDCFLRDAATCATVFELETQQCPCPCHITKSENGSLPSQS